MLGRYTKKATEAIANEIYNLEEQARALQALLDRMGDITSWESYEEVRRATGVRDYYGLNDRPLQALEELADNYQQIREGTY